MNMFWAGVAAGAIVVGLSGYGLHGLVVDRINAKHAAALTLQADSFNKQCDAQKAVTEKVSNEYQNKVADLGKRLDALRRLYGNNASLAITRNAAAGHDGGTGKDQPAGQGNVAGTINITDFIDVAAEGEKYRLQLLACQSYVQLTDPRQTAGKRGK